ncbi:hypothetical protein B0H13DRAFT_1909905 [Mycena leptocephala]|nr:hypothetical protein B0H13DRAFT_1909905 [Mycena leptocephala]
MILCTRATAYLSAAPVMHTRGVHSLHQTKGVWMRDTNARELVRRLAGLTRKAGPRKPREHRVVGDNAVVMHGTATAPQAPPIIPQNPQNAFLHRILSEISLDVMYFDSLHAQGVTEATLRTLSKFDDPRRDAIITKLLPDISAADRIMLGDAITRII